MLPVGAEILAELGYSGCSKIGDSAPASSLIDASVALLDAVGALLS